MNTISKTISTQMGTQMGTQTVAEAEAKRNHSMQTIASDLWAHRVTLMMYAMYAMCLQDQARQVHLGQVGGV